MPSISLLRFIKLHVLLDLFNSEVVSKYEDVCEESILLLNLRTYLLISFTQTVTICSNGLVFTPTASARGIIYIYHNPITAITFICAAIHFPAGYNLSLIRGQFLSYNAHIFREVKDPKV